MKRERFLKLVADVLDSLPSEFRGRIQNVAVLVEERPRPPKRQLGAKYKPGLGKRHRLVLGVFQGVPLTQRSMFAPIGGPSHIILYQKNIEAVCSNDAAIRREVRQTLLHELGHYFGMNESQLRDV